MESGQSLGPYRILEPLGAGGMGEVYLAQDTRLGRQVAVKVLPLQFAGDPERLARFEQEARAAAALNHPHIAAVFDVGAEGEGEARIHYMVQEYLQGETLREALAGRPDLSRALELGEEIVESLVAAHAAGIVHRDLKPENIFVTEDGHAKVLDFGLAKLTELSMAASGAAGQTLSPTVMGTVAGQIMGTAGYMAPEQIEGRQADPRADLFAFGCVLYEMVTGQRAFGGKSVHDTLHRIVDEEPTELGEIDRSLPLRLQWLLEKCLAKAPGSRYQSAADLLVDLRKLDSEVETGTAQPLRAPAAPAPSGEPAAAGHSTRLVAAVVVAAVALTALVFWWLQPAAETLPQVHFAFDPVEDQTFSSSGRRVIDLSPDGQRIAFTDEGAIWLRNVGDPELVQVRGTDGATSPLFSPDGEWIAFWNDGQLRKVPVDGGAPLALVACNNPAGTSWELDGTILIGQGPGGILRVSENGGEPEQLLALEDTERVQGPSLLPGGEWLLFTLRLSGERWDDGRVVAQSLSTGERRILVRGGREPRYLASGHITFVRDGNLFAVPFDAGALEVTGGAVPLIEGVQAAGGSQSGGAFYDLSAAGDLVYISGFGGGGGNLRLAFYDMDGNLEVLPFAAQSFDDPSVSPDGQRLASAVAGDDGSRSVWLYDLGRETRQRLTSGEYPSSDATWSPDGEWVYFRSNVDGEELVYRRRSDFTGDREPVGGPGGANPSSVSPDGKLVAFHTATADIGLLDTETGEAEMIIVSPALEVIARFSPDGRYLSYMSNEGDGTFRGYIRDLETGERHVLSTGGAGYPMWSPAGDALYYNAQPMMMVPVSTDDGLRLGSPSRLFDTRAIAAFPNASIEITPDGQRFLILTQQEAPTADEETEPVRIHVLLNWVQELQRRVTSD